MSLVCDSGWILTKNGILKKVNALLASLQEPQELLVNQTQLPVSTSKISRGENYRGLPYLVLDYPRVFNQSDVCAIRTFFWWGHFFSTTLHLSGSYQRRFADSIANQYQQAIVNELWIGVGADPWQYHLERDNYVPVDGVTEEFFVKQVKEHMFLKLSAVTPLTAWENAPDKLLKDFSCLIGLME